MSTSQAREKNHNKEQDWRGKERMWSFPFGEKLHELSQ